MNHCHIYQQLVSVSCSVANVGRTVGDQTNKRLQTCDLPTEKRSKNMVKMIQNNNQEILRRLYRRESRDTRRDMQNTSKRNSIEIYKIILMCILSSNKIW